MWLNSPKGDGHFFSIILCDHHLCYIRNFIKKNTGLEFGLWMLLHLDLLQPPAKLKANSYSLRSRLYSQPSHS